MSRPVEEIRKEYEKAKKDLSQVEGKYGSDPKHPIVGQHYENVKRLERELSEARR